MGLKSKYIFPAILTEEEKGYSVQFPDLPGCLPYGSTLEEVQKNAREALALHLYGMDKDGEDIPEASSIRDLKIEKHQCVILIDVLMAPYLQQIFNQSVKKTLTIPKWLDDLAKENNVNYSQVLQSAIKKQVGIEERHSVNG
ncbi:type II toxin-antitoxin system HicB family antitoxin [Sporolactobacillus sp. THM19-2]|uniref:type II toxin-antitoxin system HicB family antitoxin n=1 Tax=Sporolactobacillus sp. THM19-2 TaxID=2511171 RepID=UPI001021BD9D|nr:type II toxin-antitoxin system HicB family antitoxin [Sporolactobacillus sp. THM19-2]RYL88462.1 type II toxin-antitoxin system HicB family antitoxin [Sporolactobacillus sp. THM19-2]